MKTIKDKNYSFKHTVKRLQERYGIVISNTEYDDMCFIARSGTLISTEKQKANTQYVYDINFKDKQIRVVWSDYMNCITTVLPKKSVGKTETPSLKPRAEKF